MRGQYVVQKSKIYSSINYIWEKISYFRVFFLESIIEDSQYSGKRRSFREKKEAAKSKDKGYLLGENKIFYIILTMLAKG